VTLIGREKTFQGFRDTVLELSGVSSARLKPGVMDLATEPGALAQAELIVLATKSTGLEQVIHDLAGFAPKPVPVISLLNGVAPVRQLREALPGRQIIPGMVPFNVVWKSPAHLHRSSAGELVMERCGATEALARAVQGTEAAITLYDDLVPVQYGKLLLNLVNPINALSGMTLYKMLSQRDFRRIYSAVLSEALDVYDAAGINWQKVGPISPKQGAWLLGLPDWLFNHSLLKVQKIDRATMTSMAVDLASGRETEIDMLNGEIKRLAALAGVGAPLNSRLVELIKGADAPVACSADALAAELGL